MTRTDAAIQIRDHALVIIRQHGQPQPMGEGLNMLAWRGETFAILHRTPFQRVPGANPADAIGRFAAKHGLSSEEAKYTLALNGVALPEILPYGLDIWCGKKVLNLEWDDAGAVHIAGFKRGPWEAEFLGLAV
jgi:hypothetical protein